LGAPYAPLLPAPKPGWRADAMVLESTYGDGLHPDRRSRRQALTAVLQHALADGGTVLIPAFSLGRTQELLYEIEGIIHSGGDGSGGGGSRDGGGGSGGGREAISVRGEILAWSDLEIIVDSPLASRFTEVFKAAKPFWDAEARRRVRSGRHPLSFEQLYTIDDHQSHLNAVEYLAESGRPAVVIAASGMATGGRIVNYLKAMVGEARNDVVFVGYQAAGTPGRAIQTYGPSGGYVVLDGRRYTIRCGIHTLRSYSAHADQAGLVRFASRFRHPPQWIRLVHGEHEAQEALARELARALPGVTVD
jgi:metallo-beta-lactamase family protein